MRRPSRNDYDRIIKKERATARLSDKTLYDLCGKYPKHEKRAHIHAKIWLIARAMATGIERHIKSDKTQTGTALDKLERYIQRNSSDMEDIFKNLHRITGTLSEDSLTNIVSCHGRFLKLLSSIVKKSKLGRSSTVRSFAAKYMHFHSPLVPIYDNVNATKLKSLYPLRELRNSEMPENADREYFRFVERLRRLASELNLNLRRRCIRDLDHYLRVLSGNSAN